MSFAVDDVHGLYIIYLVIILAAEHRRKPALFLYGRLKIRRLTRKLRCPVRPARTRIERLGRNAAHVNTCAAVHPRILLDQGHALSHASQLARQCLAALAESDNNRVVLSCFHLMPPFFSLGTVPTVSR